MVVMYSLLLPLEIIWYQRLMVKLLIGQKSSKCRRLYLSCLVKKPKKIPQCLQAVQREMIAANYGLSVGAVTNTINE